jgi:hypothetical protein
MRQRPFLRSPRPCLKVSNVWIFSFSRGVGDNEELPLFLAVAMRVAEALLAEDEPAPQNGPGLVRARGLVRPRSARRSGLSAA